VLTASASENEDLFWALCGGGGNFGVVTSFEFRAHPVHTVLGGLLLYPREMAVDVIRHFRDYIESAPDELTAYVALLYGQDGAPLVGVIPCYCGDIADGQRVLQPLRMYGNPIVDSIQPMPFPAMQSLLGPFFPDGNQNYWKSTLQRQLPDDAITAIVGHSNRMNSRLSFVVCEYYGGAAGGSRRKRPHSRTAICRGIFCLLRSGPRRRRRLATATGLAPARKSFGLSLRTRICFPCWTSKQKKSSIQLLVRTYRGWPPSKRNTIPQISSA
jgi:hypothetical protein